MILPLLLSLFLLGGDGPSLRAYASPKIALAAINGGAAVAIHAWIDGEVNGKWYCPTVTFRFPDTTKSVRGGDCPPFEEMDNPEIHWEVKRIFPPGEWTVQVELSKNDKVFAREDVAVRVGG